jgi:hypothetical protein
MESRNRFPGAMGVHGHESKTTGMARVIGDEIYRGNVTVRLKQLTDLLLSGLVGETSNKDLCSHCFRSRPALNCRRYEMTAAPAEPERLPSVFGSSTSQGYWAKP